MDAPEVESKPERPRYQALTGCRRMIYPQSYPTGARARNSAASWGGYHFRRARQEQGTLENFSDVSEGIVLQRPSVPESHGA